MSINIPLLRKTLEYAENHPEEINLRHWATKASCGTTACVAGTAVLLAGHQIDYDFRPEHRFLDGDGGFTYRTTDARLIADVAQEELGLTDDGADDLFHCSSLAQVWKVAEALTGGEITRPLKP
jgi:hypothetical protein